MLRVLCIVNLMRLAQPTLPCLLQNHRFSYNEPMPVESCTQALCDVALSFGDSDQEGGMVSKVQMAQGAAACF